MHQGTPLFHKRLKSVVVYDGGGGVGSDRLRYYNPRIQRIHISQPGEMMRLDGTEFDPKDLFVRPWEGMLKDDVVVQEDFAVRNFRVHPRIMACVPDWRRKGYQRFWVRSRDDRNWSPNPELRPEPCQISVEGKVKMKEDGRMFWVMLNGDPNPVPLHHVVEDRFFDYDPAKEPSALVELSMGVIRGLLEEYDLFIKGIKPRRAKI